MSDRPRARIRRRGPALLLPLGCAASALAAVGLAVLPPARAATSGTGPVPPGNLLTGDNADFGSGTGSWYAASGATGVRWVSQPSRSSPGALAFDNVANLSGTVLAGSGRPGAGTATPAVAGARYVATASMEAATLGRAVSGLLVFYDSTGAPTGSAWGQGVNDRLGSWVSLAPTVGIAPANTSSVAFLVAVHGALVGETHYVDDVVLEGNGNTTGAVTAPLSTSGNRIYDAAGPVVFRGLNRDGAERSAADLPADGEIAHAAAWGANFVRLPLSESLWLNTCTAARPSNDPGYPTRVDAAVSSITSRHMVALLSLQWNVVAQCGAAGPQPMADAAYAPGFWSAVAARYASNPLVAFDLYNEPHSITDSVWLSGGAALSGTTVYQAAGMQPLYDTVRAGAPQNLVFVSGNDWANRPAARLVAGTNIVNGIHDYTCPSTPCFSLSPYDAAAILQNWTGVAAGEPVMVTEFGYPGETDGTFNLNVVAAAEGYGWGWSAFAWDGTASGEFDLVADVTDYEPAATGMPVLAGLTCNTAGSSRTAVAGMPWCPPA